MAKITFSDVNQAGDIPNFEITKNRLLDDFVTSLDDMMETREGKVVVCFQSWENADYEFQHQDFLVSSDEITISDFFENYIKNIDDNEIDFNFFCFDTYEDAFKYCIDLKEGL